MFILCLYTHFFSDSTAVDIMSKKNQLRHYRCLQYRRPMIRFVVTTVGYVFYGISSNTAVYYTTIIIYNDISVVSIVIQRNICSQLSGYYVTSPMTFARIAIMCENVFNTLLIIRPF